MLQRGVEIRVWNGALEFGDEGFESRWVGEEVVGYYFEGVRGCHGAGACDADRFFAESGDGAFGGGDVGF